MSERDDLIAQATELGIEQPQSLPDEQLRAAIAAILNLPPADRPPRTKRYRRGPTGRR